MTVRVQIFVTDNRTTTKAYSFDTEMEGKELHKALSVICALLRNFNPLTGVTK